MSKVIYKNVVEVKTDKGLKIGRIVLKDIAFVELEFDKDNSFILFGLHTGQCLTPGYEDYRIPEDVLERLRRKRYLPHLGSGKAMVYLYCRGEGERNRLRSIAFTEVNQGEPKADEVIQGELWLAGHSGLFPSYEFHDTRITFELSGTHYGALFKLVYEERYVRIVLPIDEARRLASQALALGYSFSFRSGLRFSRLEGEGQS